MNCLFWWGLVLCTSRANSSPGLDSARAGSWTTLVGVRAPPTERSTLWPEFPAPGTADPPAPDTVIEGSPLGTGVIPPPESLWAWVLKINRVRLIGGQSGRQYSPYTCLAVLQAAVWNQSNQVKDQVCTQHGNGSKNNKECVLCGVGEIDEVYGGDGREGMVEEARIVTGARTIKAEMVRAEGMGGGEEGFLWRSKLLVSF